MWQVLVGGAVLGGIAYKLLTGSTKTGRDGTRYNAGASGSGARERQDIRVGDIVTVDVAANKLKIQGVTSGSILAKVLEVDSPDTNTLQALSLDKRIAEGTKFTVIRDAITGITPGDE